jgi:hypothetical protein
MNPSLSTIYYNTDGVGFSYSLPFRPLRALRLRVLRLPGRPLRLATLRPRLVARPLVLLPSMLPLLKLDCSSA